MRKLKVFGSFILTICLMFSITSCDKPKSGADNYDWQEVKTAEQKSASIATVSSIITKNSEAVATTEDIFTFSIEQKINSIYSLIYSTTNNRYDTLTDIKLRGSKNLATGNDLIVKDLVCKGASESKVYTEGVEKPESYFYGFYDAKSTESKGISMNSRIKRGEEEIVSTNREYTEAEVSAQFTQLFNDVGNVRVYASDLLTLPACTTVETVLTSYLRSGLKVKTFENGTKSGVRYELTKEYINSTLFYSNYFEKVQKDTELYDTISDFINKLSKGIDEISYSVIFDSETGVFEEYSVFDASCDASFSFSLTEDGSKKNYGRIAKFDVQCVKEYKGAKKLILFTVED